MKANESGKGCARETFCVAWQFIDWQKVRGKVKSLQRRIVKAIKEGRHNRASALQWLLTHSWSAKLLAVKRVTENSGKRTAGVDGVIWRTPEQKLEAARSLTRKRYRAQPLRRIYIPKRNGKMRPLGIPAMYDRAQQALYLLALDPISETTADNCSYGFRPKRGCADAIIKCFTLLARKNGAEWILEGDIKGCFDHINHEWISENIPMDKRVLEQWLKAGFIDNKRLARNICIQRHWLIKGAANPYDPDWDFYFLSRKYRKVDQLPLISVYSLWPARRPGAFPRAFTKA